MLGVDIGASDKEDAGPALERAEGDVPADLCRKAATAASWPIRCFRVWVTSSRMASS